MVHILAYGATDVGRKRDHNEDRFVCDADLGIYVVCDGMGGHAAGEVAAEMVCDHLVQAIREARQVEPLSSADAQPLRAGLEWDFVGLRAQDGAATRHR